MSTVTVDRAAAPTGRTPRIRHGFLAAALLAVAGLHALSADWLWTAVLGSAGAAELVVWRLGRRDRRQRARRVLALPDEHALERSERAHRQAARMWGALVALAILTGAALVAESPALAAVLGVVALVALTRLRRERRSVDVLAAVRRGQAAAAPAETAP